MSGVTKHIFNQEVRDILSMWDCEIKTIEPLLPKEYSSGDIITLLKEFYPHEWHSVEIKYNPHKFLIEWEVDRPTSQMSSQWDIHLKNQSEPCVVNLSFHTSFH